MTKMTPLQLAERVLAAFEEGDLAAIDELVHPAHRQHPPDMGNGREGVRASIRSLHKAFDDVVIAAEDLIAAGDRVVARVRFSGRQIGTVLGRPPTRRRVSVQHVHIWRVADGLLAEHWTVRDDLSALQQLDAEALASNEHDQTRRGGPRRSACARNRLELE